MESSSATVRPMITRSGRSLGLAFGSKRLAQIVPGGVRLFDSTTWKVIKEVSLKTAIALGTLADGSLLAVERSDNATVAVHIPLEGALVRYPMRHLVFGGSRELIGDPSSARRFFLLDEERKIAELYELVLVAGFLRLCKRLDLSTNARKDVVALGDGSLVHCDLSDLQRIGPIPATGDPPRTSTKWPRPDADILAPGPRGDTIYAAAPSGDIVLAQIPAEGAARIDRVMKVVGPIYQLESAKGAVGVLRLEQPDTGPERWTVVVLDEQGQQRMTASLPPEPPAVPLATPPRNRCLRLSAECVAIGGPTELTIWESGSGRVVHHNTAPSP